MLVLMNAWLRSNLLCAQLLHHGRQGLQCQLFDLEVQDSIDPASPVQRYPVLVSRSLSLNMLLPAVIPRLHILLTITCLCRAAALGPYQCSVRHCGERDIHALPAGSASEGGCANPGTHRPLREECIEHVCQLFH